ncbi:MAG: lipopolysaccharide biosynthesis protein [Acidimicrobiia bacterium]
MTTTAEHDRSRDQRGTVLIIVATAFSALAVLGFQALASRSLGVDDFSPIAIMWTLTFLLYTVLMLPAEQHITRALVVTRTPHQLTKIRRDAVIAFSVAFVIGIGFTVATLDRFFNDQLAFVAIAALISVSRSVMATGRGTLAGHRRFSGYGASIAVEAGALLLGGVFVYMVGGGSIAFTLVMGLAPVATLVVRPFKPSHETSHQHLVDAQRGVFLVWLIAATSASQLIIAGGPIAVSFVGGTAGAVSVFFVSFALLRGPVSASYNLVARVLPDFTSLAHGDNPGDVWRWGPRLALGGAAVAVFGAVGSGLLLGPIVEAIYGAEFVPPQLAAALGGAGVGLGLGALFATQIYTATALGKWLAGGWLVGLVIALGSLVASDLEPISRVALAFVAGEGTGLLLLGLVFPRFVSRD